MSHKDPDIAKAKLKVSPTMQAAYEYAMANGGVLVRFPGGYHQPVEWKIDTLERVSEAWGTSTIEALVKRGYARYTKWQDGRRGPFPIEATMLSHEAMALRKERKEDRSCAVSNTQTDLWT